MVVITDMSGMRYYKEEEVLSMKQKRRNVVVVSSRSFHNGHRAMHEQRPQCFGACTSRHVPCSCAVIQCKSSCPRLVLMEQGAGGRSIACLASKRESLAHTVHILRPILHLISNITLYNTPSSDLEGNHNGDPRNHDHPPDHLRSGSDRQEDFLPTKSELNHIHHRLFPPL
jgi:hypothetical protein